MKRCPCGTGKTYDDCCGQFILQRKLPSSPEELMRSRYTAYTEANSAYIAETMKSPAADHFDAVAAKKWAQTVNWLGLDVINSSRHDAIGFVEFIAHFSENNQKKIIHELSEFHFENGKWYYVDGKIPKQKIPITKKSLRRNEMCFCGSGKKYKKCCGR